MRGNGVSRSVSDAVKWFEKAANKGHMKAKYELGKIYYYGKGDIKQNFERSAKWLLGSAINGNDDAQYKLGVLYLKGQGVTKSGHQAQDWLSKASEQNNPYALLVLGKMYYHGQSIGKDIVKARALLTIARDQGDEEAETLLYDILKKEDSKKNNVNSGKSITASYLKKANNGSANAQFLLARSYLTGSNNLKKNIKQAVEWLHKAAGRNHAQAQYVLGNIYYKGKGIRNDTRKAKKWLKKSAKQKNKQAKKLFNVILAYEQEAKKLSREKKMPAYRYLVKAERDDESAQFELGQLYLTCGKAWS